MAASPVSTLRRDPILVVGLGLVVLALAAGWWASDDAANGTADKPLATRQADGAAPAAQAGLPPRSLHGTVPDGNLQGSAHALPYAELRRLFDYYLSTQGEQSLAAITQQIQRELQQRLTPAAVPGARRVLDLYLAYKGALVELESKPDLRGNAVQAIRRRLEALHDLRARYFTEAEAQGLFGQEDAYDRDAVARLEISEDASLTEAQKQQRLAALDAALPQALRTERDAVHVVTQVEQRVQALRAQGAGDDEVYRLRAQAFDAQAAARLAEVDREEDAWKARIAHYRQERERVMQNQTVPTEREQALDQLRQTLFSEAERPRLVAYESSIMR